MPSKLHFMSLQIAYNFVVTFKEKKKSWVEKTQGEDGLWREDG